ncbi:MAG: hypothetical protein O2820_11970 [Planctomycetota bacterium]|nr:hypothetical protein [Planctomycetota bacterium]MDA1249927.1 hypothetical protein [Planctomycetota bacterium]
MNHRFSLVSLAVCLLFVGRIADAAELKIVSTPDAWTAQRKEILAGLERVMGPLPGKEAQVPLDVRTIQESGDNEIRRTKISFQSDKSGRVHAWLLRLEEDSPPKTKRPAVLCLLKSASDGPVLRP